MADSLHEAASSASRDPSFGGSTAGSLSPSPSAPRHSSETPSPSTTGPTATSAARLQPNARASSDGASPRQLQGHHDHGPDSGHLTPVSSSSSRHNYEPSPSPSSSKSYTNSIQPTNLPANSPVNTSAARTASHRTSHRHNRSSGAFLLADPLSSKGHASISHGKPTLTHTRSSQRESTVGSHTDRTSVGRAAGAGLRAAVAAETPEKNTKNTPTLTSNTDINTPDSVHSNGSSRQSHDTSTSGTARAQTPESAAAAAPPAAPAVPAVQAQHSTQLGTQPLDLDSAQIVNMALNLSESRRRAARRTVSQQLPPRLSPLPDNAVGGSLLRQLQQQRRISRTMSPKPDRAGGGRVSSSGQFPSGQHPHGSTSTGSPLQPPFELLPDGTPGGQGPYRYHFSQSTLARAQKAKDHLELLAQHRRLLELIPPLTPDATSRSRATSLGSPPTTSAIPGQPQPLFMTGTNSNGDLVLSSTRLGRPYNPLQYIRNRKVRVRERRTIDGQAQGFGDVIRTTDWIDDVAKWTATGQGRMLGGYTLPAFHTADAGAALQSSPPSISRTAGQTAPAKPKRPRIDWIIDPADMIADVYWLEQGDNMKLVEDHHWRRVFPQDSALYRPISQRGDDGMVGAVAGADQSDSTGPATFSMPTADVGIAGASSRPLYALPVGGQLKAAGHLPEPEQLSASSARKRARQKLSELRSFHHRHNSSAHSHDAQRLRRGSFSDTSDSDNDRRRFRRARPDSSTANDVEVLNRTMMDKMAKENGETEENAATATSAAASKEQKLANGPPTVSTSNTPSSAKRAQPDSASPAQRPTSTTAAASVDSPSKQGRASLEIPSVGRRLSLDYDSSRPTSPELRPFSKDGLGFVPPLGGDLSPPSSRAASPPRHRTLGKVKSMFHDHSRDRERERDRAHNIMLDRGDDSWEPSARSSAPAQHLQQQQTQQTQQQVQEAQPKYQEYVESTSAPLTAVSTLADDLRAASSNEAKATHSPLRKLRTRTNAGTFDTHRSHSSIAGLANHGNHDHHRSEEGESSAGTLRGFFKGGPRIDTVLRSGVSKVSDILWRREGSEPLYGDAAAPASASTVGAAAHVSQSSSDDDSEPEAAPRGRFRNSPIHSRSPSANAESEPQGANKSHSTTKTNEKHYLNIMPSFGRGGGHSLHRPPSRQSARFERLKPPRIDVSDASPSADDVANNAKQLGEEPAAARRRNSSLQPLGRQLQQPYRGSQDSDYSESDTRSRRSSRVSGAASSISGSLGLGLQPLPRKFSTASATGGIKGSRPRWSLSQPAYHSKKNHGPLSRRELARLRASMYSSAVLAKELSRRANEPMVLVRSWTGNGTGNGKANGKANGNSKANGGTRRRSSTALDAAVVDTSADADDETNKDVNREHDDDNDDDAGSMIPKGDTSGPIIVRGSNGEQSLTWADIAAYGPTPAELARRPIKQVELYPLAAQVLGSAVQRSGQSWQVSAETFANTTVPQLRQRIERVRSRVAVDLSGLASQAADEADEVTRDLMAVQRLQVKRVEDSIDKMMRRRRRRFRWVRRAGWLTVEWLLVGFMWYVWFVVMLARIVLGFGRGIYTGVRWLLCL
ncbi:uncharacterized protein SPSK_01372 [Sporothrix schenckii 1099-18]|uniref:Uncharacterized protein n=1 Tax=Sporothrix schenckii 1099-18 TaxID=1397361 RepID=A0A0F2MDL5_SPOSC|nr:uncharacterized protein SPSK_01372 [Sporothrix schenckii 1099-18]KJR87179.1 hypothetical protein SPSK_01372 [Sporothrix schenckii 1099-18]